MVLQRTTRRGAAIALVALVWVSAACTPMLTPPPLPSPATNDDNPDLAPRAGDVKHSLADIQRAKDDLGYRPTTDVLGGLKACLNWWRQRSAARAVEAVA